MRLEPTRALEIDTELCVRNVGNYRFDLVLIAAQRTRELRRHAKESGKFISCIDALLDIQNGLVNPRDYLRKVK
jgi:DNA-directed RNA polymerase subunit K/omega